MSCKSFASCSFHADVSLLRSSISISIDLEMDTSERFAKLWTNSRSEACVCRASCLFRGKPRIGAWWKWFDVRVLAKNRKLLRVISGKFNRVRWLNINIVRMRGALIAKRRRVIISLLLRLDENRQRFTSCTDHSWLWEQKLKKIKGINEKHKTPQD